MHKSFSMVDRLREEIRNSFPFDDIEIGKRTNESTFIIELYVIYNGIEIMSLNMEKLQDEKAFTGIEDEVIYIKIKDDIINEIINQKGE